jgi:type I restriction enzyme M protein
MKREHLKPVEDWWNDKKEIEIDGFFKAKKYTIDEIKERNYNLDLCGYPYEEETVLPPMELLKQYQEKRAELDKNIDDVLARIKELIGGTNDN